MLQLSFSCYSLNKISARFSSTRAKFMTISWVYMTHFMELQLCHSEVNIFWEMLINKFRSFHFFQRSFFYSFPVQCNLLSHLFALLIHIIFHLHSQQEMSLLCSICRSGLINSLQYLHSGTTNFHPLASHETLLYTRAHLCFLHCARARALK